MQGWTTWLGLRANAVAGFQETLSLRYGAARALLTNSGTSALRLAISVAARGRTRVRVAVPAYCCYDVATAVIGARAEAVLYDIDPGTLGPDLSSLSAALNEGAEVVVVAHLFGMPVDVARVRDMCAAGGAVVVEDAAQASGGGLRGRPLGALGTLSVLSFGRGKGTTGGGGGALLAHDVIGERLLENAAPLAADGGGRGLVALCGQWLVGRPAVYGIPSALPFLRLGETIYRVPQEPRGMSPVTACILQTTMALSESELLARRRAAARLLPSVLSNPLTAGVSPVAGAEPGYLRLPVIAHGSAHAALTTRKAARLGVMPGYPRTLAELEGFRDVCVGRERALMGARELATRLCTLPTHSLLREVDFTQLDQLVRSAGTGEA